MFKAPIIILNPEKTLQVTRSRKLTDSDQSYLTRNYDMDSGDPNRVDKRADRFSSEQKKTHERWKRWFNTKDFNPIGPVKELRDYK